MVLAGPGVLDRGALDGLRTFAAVQGLGVANTWGAKGVFSWDSPHHLGTCGLQARDFALLGWADADAIIATGIDEAESPREHFALAEVIDIEPGDLAALASIAPETVDRRPPVDNHLYARLAAVARPGYVDEKVPLHPARAVADLGAVLPPGGLVAADPGVAGLWVARTFPTPALAPGEPRRVIVPARREAGVAVRLAAAAARAGRPAIAVTTGPLDDATNTMIDEAAAAALDLVIVVWGEIGDHPGPRADANATAHRGLVADALATPGPSIVQIPIAFEDTALLVQAAGEVVAWGGLT